MQLVYVLLILVLDAFVVWRLHRQIRETLDRPHLTLTDLRLELRHHLRAMRRIRRRFAWQW